MGVHAVRPDGDGPFPVHRVLPSRPRARGGIEADHGPLAEWGYYVVTHDRYHRAEPWYTSTHQILKDAAGANSTLPKPDPTNRAAHAPRQDACV